MLLIVGIVIELIAVVIIPSMRVPDGVNSAESRPDERAMAS
jgi:hypothetical protein